MCTVTKNHQCIDAVVILKISRKTQRMYALYDNDCWLVSVELSIQNRQSYKLLFKPLTFIETQIQYFSDNLIFIYIVPYKSFCMAHNFILCASNLHHHLNESETSY